MIEKALNMPSSHLSFLFLLSLCVFLPADSRREDVSAGGMPPSLVERSQRKSLMVTEYGEVSAVDVKTGRTSGSYHLEFMTLEPNSLFLPVLLHADMVFYVNSGSGKLSWTEDGKEMRRMNIKRGDVYRLHAGSVFFVQSNLESERQKLRIYSIYSNTDEDIYVSSIGAYTSTRDLVLGFDRKLLQSAFNVGDDVIEEIETAIRPPAIVHALPEKRKSMFREIEARLLKALIGNTDGAFHGINKGSKKTKTFNILEADPDFENCNGWSRTVDRKDLKSLRGSNIGVFMVNLTKGSMMGPHWNPMATEIAIVLQGEGMVRVVCGSNVSETSCGNKRFRVKEGDVFAVPRFYPMAQMSFNNDTFVFMGFSTSTRKNYPQFLAGKRSVFQTLNKDILALSFNVSNSTIDAFLTPQEEAIILDCTSCAEEEEIKMEREGEDAEAREREEERKREEEKRKREEEEEEREREREQKEAEKRRQEERRRREERARREQEEARRQEEERQRRRREKEEEARREREREQEEEERKREEEEKRRQEEEAKEAERERERREREQKQAEKRRQEERRRREEVARKEQEEARRQEEERQRRHREKEAEREGEEEAEGGEGQTEDEKRRKAARKVYNF